MVDQDLHKVAPQYTTSQFYQKSGAHEEAVKVHSRINFFGRALFSLKLQVQSLSLQFYVLQGSFFKLLGNFLGDIFAKYFLTKPQVSNLQIGGDSTITQVGRWVYTFFVILYDGKLGGGGGGGGEGGYLIKVHEATVKKITMNLFV